jgi:hypothetical protein
MAKLELVSPFPLEECQHLLRDSLQRSTEVDGSITGTELRARKRISYRNSFQIRLSAELLDEGGATRIICRFGIHPFVIVFLVFWFGMLLLIGGGGIVSGVIELISGRDARDLARQLIPAMMLIFGVLFVLVGRFLAGGERLALTTFISETLKATPCP